jgi:hypothetical protein
MKKFWIAVMAFFGGWDHLQRNELYSIWFKSEFIRKEYPVYLDFEDSVTDLF